MACQKCGKDHGDGCSAHRSHGGEPCKQTRGLTATQDGRRICATHGGRSPNLRAVTESANVERKALLAIRREGVEPVGDPVELLLSLTAEAAEWQRQLREIVAGLSLIRYEDAKGAEQLRSEIALYERALDRTQKFATDLARLNLEERQARVTERQVEITEKALTVALALKIADEAVRMDVLGEFSTQLRLA